MLNAQKINGIVTIQTSTDSSLGKENHSNIKSKKVFSEKKIFQNDSMKMGLFK